MTSLRAKDARSLLSFVADAQSAPDSTPLTTELLDRLADIVGCLSATYSEYDPRTSELYEYVPCTYELRHPPSTEAGWGDDPFSVRSTGCGLGTWSDALDRRTRLRFETTSWAGEFGVVDCLWLVVPLGRSGVASLVLHRQEQDFAERERDLLAALAPHVTALVRHGRACRRLADLTEALESDREASRGYVLLGIGDTIEQASPSGRRLLDAWFGEGRDRLPHPVEDWLRSAKREPFRIERGGRRLVIEALTRTALVLTEDSMLAGMLTAREAEILRAIADGRSTKEIAHDLWITPATVSKHLERIYRKLDVTSRTAALAALGMSGR